MSSTVQAPWGDEAKLMVLPSLQQDDLIQSRMPNWAALEQQNVIPPGFAKSLERIHSLSVRQKSEIMGQDPRYMSVLVALLMGGSDRAALQYLLAIFHDICRDDVSLVDIFNAELRKNSNTKDITKIFAPLLRSKHRDEFAKDKAGFLFSEFVARSSEGTVSDEEILEFTQAMVRNELGLSEGGKLEFLKNLLKSSRMRLPLWKCEGVPQLVLSHVDAGRLATLYQAVFCSWLFTFDETVLRLFLDAGGITRICTVLKKTKTEKIVRMCIHSLLNCLSDDDCVEAVIQQEAVQTLTLLEYEKWRDADLYNEIRDGQARLQQKIKLFSNFDRYSRELRTGVLRFSFLHSAKFWRENVLHFEENEFQAIKSVAQLLRNGSNTDVETLAVACHDLGEFAALHPTGKQVLQKLKVKDTVMSLVSHPDKKVSTEALLSLQKLMLDKWQKAASTLNQ